MIPWRIPRRYPDDTKEDALKKLVIIAFCLMLLIALIGCSGSDTEQEPVEEIEDAAIIQQNPDEAGEENLEITPNTWEWGLFPYSFTAEDLNGNIVTEETIGEKQLFILHLWATWCGSCISGMPDFAAAARNYSDRVGVIGLLDDFSTNPDGARLILDASNLPETFINIDARLPELQELMMLVSTGRVPTSIIISSDGQISEPIVGSLGPGYAALLESLLGDAEDPD